MRPKLRIVASRDGMIFDRVATLLETALADYGVDVVRMPYPDRHAYDATLYLPYYFLDEKTEWDVPLFTHLEDTPDMEAKRFRFYTAGHLADVCLAMSNRTASLLPPWKTEVAEIPATPDFSKEKIRILCPAIPQRNDRKGLGILDGWDGVKGVEVVCTGGAVSQDEMPRYYQEADYVLVTGRNEGGPMAVKEAIAMGKPVIAPDVGWAWEYPVIRYTNRDDLIGIIKRLMPDHAAWGRFADTLYRACARSPKWPMEQNTELTFSSELVGETDRTASCTAGGRSSSTQDGQRDLSL